MLVCWLIWIENAFGSWRHTHFSSVQQTSYHTSSDRDVKCFCPLRVGVVWSPISLSSGRGHGWWMVGRSKGLAWFMGLKVNFTPSRCLLVWTDTTGAPDTHTDRQTDWTSVWSREKSSDICDYSSMCLFWDYWYEIDFYMSLTVRVMITGNSIK